MDFLLDLLAELICEAIDIVCSVFLIPTYSFKKVTDIDSKVINELKNQRHVKGIIIDVDETIRFNGKSIPKEIDEWIDTITKNFKAIVLSNGYDQSIIKYFDDKGIKVISNAYKPLKKYFIKAKEELNLENKEILVIGDNTLTDIFGAKRCGMLTCKVKNRKKKEK